MKKKTFREIFPEWQELINQYHGIYIYKQEDGTPFYKVNYCEEYHCFSTKGILLFSERCSKLSAIKAAKVVNSFIKENNLEDLINHLDEYSLIEQKRIKRIYKSGGYKLNEIKETDEELLKDSITCMGPYTNIDIDEISVLIDAEDYSRVIKYTWHYNNGTILLRRKVNGKIKTIYLTRFILNCYNDNFEDIGPVDEKGNKYVVHMNTIINNSILNYRRNNISLVTNKEHKRLLQERFIKEQQDKEIRRNRKKLPLYGKHSKNLFALVDGEDFERVNKYTWYMHINGYVLTTINQQRISLHRFIMNPPDDMVVDHIGVVPYDEAGNRIIIANKLNNTKENLRIVTQKQNSWNNKGKSKNGYKGISIITKIRKDGTEYKKWLAEIGIGNKTISLGRFPYTEEGKLAAMRTYNEKAKELYGEFARLNQIDGIEYNNEEIIIQKDPTPINILDLSLIPPSNKYAYIPLYGKDGIDKISIVNKEDEQFLNQFKWIYDGRGYACASFNGKKLIMHREIIFRKEKITDEERTNYDELVVDHKSHDTVQAGPYTIISTLNNTRENLRFATMQQNAINSVTAKNSKSRMKGVSLYTKKNISGTKNFYWNVTISERDKNNDLYVKSIKKFPLTEQGWLEAAKLYNEIMQERYGKFAYLNKLDGTIKYPEEYVKEITTIDLNNVNDINIDSLPNNEEYKYLPLFGEFGKDKFVIVSKEDFDYLKQFQWICTNNFEVFFVLNKKHFYLKDFVMYRVCGKNKDNRKVCIINEDDIKIGNYIISGKLNFSRNNLRYDLSNIEKRRLKPPKDGMKGVYHNKIKSTNGTFYYKWTAYIYDNNNKLVFLGNFDDNESGRQKAMKAYNEKAIELYGNMVYLNKVDESKIIPDNPENYDLSFLCTIQIDVEDKELIDKYKWNLAEGYITSTEFADGTKIDNGTKYNCVQLGKVLLGMSPLDLNSVVFRDKNYLNYHKSNLKVVYRNTKIELVPIIDGKFDMRNVDISQYQDYLGNTLSKDDLVDCFYQSNIPNTKVIQVGNRFALVDEEDFNKVIKYQWKVSNNNIIIHNVRMYEFEYGIRMPIQSIILGLPDGYKFKKLNGNTFDCRKENIKIICKKKTNK